MIELTVVFAFVVIWAVLSGARRKACLHQRAVRYAYIERVTRTLEQE